MYNVQLYLSATMISSRSMPEASHMLCAEVSAIEQPTTHREDPALIEQLERRPVLGHRAGLEDDDPIVREDRLRSQRRLGEADARADDGRSR